MSSTHLVAYLHLYCIYMVRMHGFSKYARCLSAVGVGRGLSQRPTLDAGVASVQCMQMADSHFKALILFRSPFLAFYCFFGLL